MSSHGKGLAGFLGLTVTEDDTQYFPTEKLTLITFSFLNSLLSVPLNFHMWVACNMSHNRAPNGAYDLV